MTSEVRILIIDDEAAIRNLLKTNLAPKGYKVQEATDGLSGIRSAKDFHPHLILLDLGLPDMHGSEVLKELRTWSRVPIIILTVTDSEDTKVRLLDAGADDYLTKPFGVKELDARVRVALRNVGLIEATPVFKSAELEIDISNRIVKVRNEEVKLTNTEFEVLLRLARDPGKVIAQAVLLKQVWGVTSEGQSHYLRIYINQLRKKLEQNPTQPEHILTEPGVGYRLI